MRNNLRYARMNKGLTRSKLAELIGISPQHYKKIECGDRLGSIKTWDALEDALGVHQRILREND